MKPTRYCPHGHDKDVVGRYHGRCRACRALDPTRNTVTHARTAKRRLVERRSWRKRANARDLDRLEALLGSTEKDR